MIILEKVHPAIVEAIRRILGGENEIPTCTIMDYDGCNYDIRLDEDNTHFLISIIHSVPLKVFKKYNLDGMLKKHFSEAEIAPTPVEGCHVTIRVPIGTDETDALIAKASQLRIILMCAPLAFAAEKHANGEAFEPIRLAYRQGESIYIYTNKGNLVFMVSLSVPHVDDRLFVKQFLYEFDSARKNERTCAGSPSFSFLQGQLVSLSDPALKKILAEPESDETFWVSFSLSQNHVDPKKLFLTTQHLTNFRNHAKYHIACCKSYMHSKMRARVTSSLQVINRAKTTTTGKSKVQLK